MYITNKILKHLYLSVYCLILKCLFFLSDAVNKEGFCVACSHGRSAEI